MRKLAEKTAQVAVVRNGLRHIRLACKLGVANHSLVTDNIEIPKDAIGRVRFSCTRVTADMPATTMVLQSMQDDEDFVAPGY